ncbi:MAG TPA: MerR family transcriptional regulator [Thermoanaerobaculia bacterium]|jgi:DNA-binding transcriptional MerR regulator
MTESLWKIGDLAQRTGVSIRTLHHYDEIGLLSPSHRTPAGHRLYGREEVVRLQQILSLRQNGFSLEEIRDLLTRRDFDARSIIDLHLKRLREQIASQQDLCARLEAIATRYPTATAEEFIKAIEVMTMFEKYYSKEQLDTLAQRREAIGEERMAAVPQEWMTLMQSVREHMRAGTDPKDPRVQELAKKWRALIDEFTGGDPGIAASLKKMYESEPQVAQQQGVDREMTEYIAKAMA